MKTLPDGRIQIEAGDTLYGIYGPNWKALSGYTGDPTKLPIGTVLNSPNPTTAPAGNNTNSAQMAQLEAMKKQLQDLQTKAGTPSNTGTGPGTTATSPTTSTAGSNLTPQQRKDIEAQLQAAQEQLAIKQQQLKDQETLKSLGVSDSTINTLGPDGAATLAAVGTAFKAQYDAGKTVPPVLTQTDLDRIFQEAQNDPNISKYYQDKLTMSKQDLSKAVASLSADYTEEQRKLAQSQPLEQQALSEGEAAAGRAYSGFRTAAESRLKADQQGIIESTKRTAQNSLNSLGTSFEKNFGSANTSGLAIGTDLTYTPYGGVAGQNEADRLAAIRDREQSLRADLITTRGLNT